MLEHFPFKFKEFNITGNDIPEIVATKILIYHILPAVLVRVQLGMPIWPSLNSCWRPYYWEIQNSRDGGSQHCFGQDKYGNFDRDSKGACDWACGEFNGNKELLLQALIDNTDYTRFGIYGSFIHCDYKKTSSGKRQVYNHMWEKQYIIK